MKILTFVNDMGQVSFAELAREFPEHKGDLELNIQLSPDTLKMRAPKGSGEDFKRTLSAIRKKGCALLWSGSSEEFIDAFLKLKNNCYITITPTLPMTYVLDGIVLRADNWLPIVMNITEKGKEALQGH
jgi:hypothetical protein